MSKSVAAGVHSIYLVIRIHSTDYGEVIEILEKGKVRKQQITALPYSDGEFNQILIMFSCSKLAAEEIEKELFSKGFGVYGSDSDVTVLPLSLAKDMRNAREIAESEFEKKNLDRDVGFGEFSSSIKARIAVENMLEVIYEGASFTFDFFVLTVVAGWIALVGLVTNSSVSIVASMLVSPLMGPILGFTFGTVVRDRLLITTSLKNEIIALFICIFIGYVGGLFAAPASMRQTPWPTSEMASRGEASGLYIGVAIAVPSGIGVALSIMGQNTNSLVGVAISASLLPPCVNCGLLLAQATLTPYYYNSECLPPANATWTSDIWGSCCSGPRSPTPLCPKVAYDTFCCWNYFNQGSVAAMGGISAALTFVNIACIWVCAAGMFYLKEVAPVPGKAELWSTLIPQARRFNIALNRGEINKKDLQKEIDKAKLSRPKVYREGATRFSFQPANGAVLPATQKFTRNQNFWKDLSTYLKEDDDIENHLSKNHGLVNQ